VNDHRGLLRCPGLTLDPESCDSLIEPTVPACRYCLANATEHNPPRPLIVERELPKCGCGRPIEHLTSPSRRR
jgi:hypothetical protein